MKRPRLVGGAAAAAFVLAHLATAQAGIVLQENFDGGSVNSIFEFSNNGGDPPEITDFIGGGGGTHGSVARVTLNTNDNNNSIAFDVVTIPSEIVLKFQFDFWMSDDSQSGAGTAADGLAFGLFPTADYGSTGAVNPAVGGGLGAGFAWERPNPGPTGSLAVGLDIWDSGGGQGTPDGNTVNLWWNGTQLGAVNPPFLLNDNRWHRIIVTAIDKGNGSADVAVDLIENVDGVGGPAVPRSLFAAEAVGLDVTALGDSLRLIGGGRTGGANHIGQFDNILLETSNVVDTDGDGMPDRWEDSNGTDKFTPDADEDPDNDMSTNIAEFNAGTDPRLADTDADGYKDGVESNTGTWVSATNTGTNPLDADTDDDGILDGTENPDLAFVDRDQPGTDPNLFDTDGDGYSALIEIGNGTDPTNAADKPSGDEIVVFEEDFDGGGINSVFTFTNSSGTPPPSIEDLGGNNVARITNLTESNNNSIAWDYVPVKAPQVEIQVDWWCSADVGQAADGWGILFGVPERVGTIGGFNTGDVWEQPTSGGAASRQGGLSFGFDVWDSGTPPGGNHLRIQGPGAGADIVAEVEVPFPINNDTFHRARIILTDAGANSLLSVRLIEDVNGAAIAHDVVTNATVNNLDISELLWRVIIGGRTGGANMETNIDNVRVFISDNIDLDGDGMPNIWEDENGTDKLVNDANEDPDGDGLNNIGEFNRGTKPLVADTDGDGANDNAENGTGTWVNAGQTGSNALDPDTDGDGLLDGVENPDLAFVDENQPGTDPNKSDTDDDGFPDLAEIINNSDPTNPASVPNISYSVVLFEDFDGGGIASTYEFSNDGGSPPDVEDTGLPSNGFAAAITHLDGSNNNSIAWDFVEAAGNSVRLTFDLRMSPDMGGEAADGFGIGFFRTDVYGDVGPINPAVVNAGSIWEDPRGGPGYPNAVFFGFDIYDGGGPNGNNLRVTGPGGSSNLLFDANFPFTLNDDFFHRVEISALANGASTLFTVKIIEDVNGAMVEHVMVENLLVPNFDIRSEITRLIAGGRTGGAFVLTELDNVTLETAGTPFLFEITDINVVPNGDDTRSVFLRWNSRANESYIVEYSENLDLWLELVDGVESEGDSTTYVDPAVPATSQNRVYRIRVGQ